ncbi:MAG: histidine kinase dimerization/phospho-acceptor domain-containing protein [Niameybacter sp.]|uniref:sensor histidine kinase n=1 Tax=Niameybacter sp. TaxID=2033640 RepID=UPI002FC8DF79
MKCYIYWKFSLDRLYARFKSYEKAYNWYKREERVGKGILILLGYSVGIGAIVIVGYDSDVIDEGLQSAVHKELVSQRMKTELISNVSHDLKTPLTSIINYVDLLKDKELSKETQQAYVEILDRKSKRLKILIEDLFEASKTASGNVELTKEKINLVALLNQTLGEMAEKIGASTLQFKVNLPDEKVMCELDGR